MLTAQHLLITTATSGRGAPWNAHLWHAIEAVTFLLVSLGGIAVAEFVQAKRRPDEHDSRPDVLVASGAALTAGRPSAVALLPARVETRLSTAPAPTPRRRATLLPLVALAGAAAAAIHVVVMPEHFEESTLYGGFFAIAALTQFGYSALLLMRPSRILLGAGLLGNAGIAVLWLITRTIGIPLGPAAGEIESFGGLDVLASFFEVFIAVGAAAILLRRQRPLLAARPAGWAPLVWASGAAAATAIAITALVSPPS